MTGVNWGALIQGNRDLWDRTNETVNALFADAREAEQKRRVAEVVDAAQSGNPDAMRKLYSINPQLAMQMEDALYQRGERQRADIARNAMSALLQGGPMPPPPAMGQMLPPAAAPDGSMRGADLKPTGTIANPAQPVDPLAPLPEAQPAQPQYSPEQVRQWEQYIGQVAQWADTPEKWDQAVDYFAGNGWPEAAQFKGRFSPQGRSALMQRGGISDAQRQLIEADPEAFLTFQGKRLDLTGKQLKGIVDLNNGAMQLLGSVHDQATYDDAKRQARQLYSSFGADASFLDSLPSQYSPETVRMLQLRGMDTSKQLAAIARENNIESQIEVREGRLAEYQRRGRAAEANTRRGQDIRSRDTRRGQDVTDRRVRETGGRRGGTPRSDLIGPVYSKGGRRIQFSKSAGGYVDVATGERVN